MTDPLPTIALAYALGAVVWVLMRHAGDIADAFAHARKPIRDVVAVLFRERVK